MLAHVFSRFLSWTFVHYLLHGDIFWALPQYTMVIINANYSTTYHFKFIRQDKRKKLGEKIQCNLNKFIKLLKKQRKIVLSY